MEFFFFFFCLQLRTAADSSSSDRRRRPVRIISMHAYALRRPEYSVSPAGSLLHIHTFVLFFCKAQPDGSDGTDAYAYVTTSRLYSAKMLAGVHDSIPLFSIVSRYWFLVDRSTAVPIYKRIDSDFMINYQEIGIDITSGIILLYNYYRYSYIVSCKDPIDTRILPGTVSISIDTASIINNGRSSTQCEKPCRTPRVNK